MACVADTMLPGEPVPYDAELVGHVGWIISMYLCASL